MTDAVFLPYAIQWRDENFNGLTIHDCSGPMPFTTSVCDISSLERCHVQLNVA
jgi:hypothetical protein